MKFAIAALLLANTQAVKIGDDCGGKWCNKGLAYDYNEADLNKAKADNVAKTHHFNGSTLSDEHAKQAAAAAGAHAALPLLLMPLLVLLSPLPPLNSLVPPTRIRLLSPRPRLPTRPPFTPRRLLSMLPSRLLTPRLRPTSSPPEREEISLPPPPPRTDRMPT